MNATKAKTEQFNADTLRAKLHSAMCNGDSAIIRDVAKTAVELLDDAECAVHQSKQIQEPEQSACAERTEPPLMDGIDANKLYLNALNIMVRGLQDLHFKIADNDCTHEAKKFLEAARLLISQSSQILFNYCVNSMVQDELPF